MHSPGTVSTLVQTLWPARNSVQTWTRGVVLVVGAVLALTISAKTQIAFWPVPMTLQSLVVLIVGAAFGWRLGSTAVAAYLLVGSLGAPIFANTPEKGIGIAYMLGPTGGFLLGFLLAAFFVGWWAERGWDRNPAKVFALFLAGTVVLFVPGLIWLGASLSWSADVLQLGLYPFLLPAVVKIAIGTLVYPGAWSITNRFLRPNEPRSDQPSR